MRSSSAIEERSVFGLHNMGALPWCLPGFDVKKRSGDTFESSEELNVSFVRQCNISRCSSIPRKPCKFEISTEMEAEDSNVPVRNSSFSCLSGAALSANHTLANTNICNGVIGEEILPHLDSPKSFKRLASSPSLSRLDSFSHSPVGISPLAGSNSPNSDSFERTRNLLKPSSAPTAIETSSFLNATDVQMAGGAAGEDRVQAVCSEENGWLFCGVYDGFNGRDAADFLASTLYDNTVLYLQHLEWCIKRNNDSLCIQDKLDMISEEPEAFRIGVLNCLAQALAQAENEFMERVEEEMDDRPDLVSIGSSVLAMLLDGVDLYIINLGDSRAVLATNNVSGSSRLQAVQLTEIHNVDNEMERKRVLDDHPDDPSPITGGKVKGKLKLTRALGVGYLKKSKLNDALMGILRVRNLCSPPYVYTHPFTTSHTVSENDLFVVLGSDGLFDFFNNHDVVNLVYKFIKDNPMGDPAKYLVEQLIIKAAESAGLTAEELMSIPVGRRRKYHDDVTVVVIILGNKQRTSTASTSL